MPGTFSQIYLQFVFAVKGRESLIPKQHKEELHKYITALAQNRKAKLLAINCMPDHFDKLDFELEVSIVIGKKGRNIRAEEADSYIAGFMIMNDMSARTLQMEEMILNLGPAKGKDFSTVIGPHINSNHFYSNGFGLDLTSSFAYMLAKPITKITRHVLRDCLRLIFIRKRFRFEIVLFVFYPQ